MTGTAVPAPEAGAGSPFAVLRDIGALDVLSIDQLQALHTFIYRDIMRRCDALERIPAWRPARRAGLRDVRARQADMAVIGAELSIRWGRDHD